MESVLQSVFLEEWYMQMSQYSREKSVLDSHIKRGSLVKLKFRPQKQGV